MVCVMLDVRWRVSRVECVVLDVGVESESGGVCCAGSMDGECEAGGGVCCAGCRGGE